MSMSMTKPLNPVQREALFESIQHWKRIVKGEEASEGTRNCALCQNYHGNDCIGCPVYQETEQACCSGTPYDKFIEVTSANNNARWAETKKSRKAARKELQFLKSIWKARAKLKLREFAKMQKKERDK
jgi:hypothetical protein